MTTLIISKDEMEDIIKIVTYPEESGLLIKMTLFNLPPFN